LSRVNNFGLNNVRVIPRRAAKILSGVEMFLAFIPREYRNQVETL
jgi:hypothetical protein